MRQIIYRQEYRPAVECRTETAICTRMVRSPLGAIPLAAAIVQTIGWLETARLFLRLCLRRRFFYCVTNGRRMVHWGSLTRGWCRYYAVGPDAVVFGPVETAVDCRGRGLAALAMRGVMTRLAAEGLKVFFVDTSEENHAMQRAAEKAGFLDTGRRCER